LGKALSPMHLLCAGKVELCLLWAAPLANPKMEHYEEES